MFAMLPQFYRVGVVRAQDIFEGKKQIKAFAERALGFSQGDTSSSNCDATGRREVACR